MGNNTQIVEKRISSIEERLEALESFILIPTSTSSFPPQRLKQMSAKEFLLSKKISSIVEITLALAYYLERVGQLNSFNIKDIAGVFQAAKEKSPANLNDMINKNIKKGYMMEARELKDNKKAWVLTSTGEKFVESELNN